MGDDRAAGDVTMTDVAAAAGVSVSTVSRALRDSPLVSLATTARVQTAAAELGFAVSRAASSLATGRQGRVAVLLGGRLGSWFNAAALDGICTGLQGSGLDLLVYRIVDPSDRAAFFARLPARRNADALVVASFGLEADEHARLDQLGMPIVYLNQRVRGAASVAIDDLAGARLATRYLLGLGHRRLAFCGVDQRHDMAWSAVLRVEGFRAELRAAGLDPAAHPVVLPPYGGHPDDVVAQLLTAGPRPTAIQAESDEIAFGLLPALARAGLRVPEDVSVLGFDDHDLAAAYGLSTVAQPVQRMGELAGRLVAELVAGAAPTSVDVDTRLVLRRTTAPPTSQVLPGSGGVSDRV
ncbi:MAG: LacI family DNA-binding transcriptional regulator [Propionibacteriaceae bacterium]